VAAEGENGDQPQFNALNYCKPVDGVIIPPDMLTTIQVWNVPPDDPDEKVEYRWQGGSAASAAQIPDCTESIILAVAPPGSVRMPDLRRFGENQAKERLAELGITNVYVDYQTRERIPELFDSYAPYAVVSTLPEPGAWVPPDTTVVLGVRAPDEAPPPATEPTAEPTAEPPPGPPPDGGSTPIPPPIEIPTPAVP
jgi:peptidoglycan glycosyltransferase